MVCFSQKKRDRFKSFFSSMVNITVPNTNIRRLIIFYGYNCNNNSVVQFKIKELMLQFLSVFVQNRINEMFLLINISKLTVKYFILHENQSKTVPQHLLESDRLTQFQVYSFFFFL